MDENGTIPVLFLRWVFFSLFFDVQRVYPLQKNTQENADLLFFARGLNGIQGSNVAGKPGAQQRKAPMEKDLRLFVGVGFPSGRRPGLSATDRRPRERTATRATCHFVTLAHCHLPVCLILKHEKVRDCLALRPRTFGPLLERRTRRPSGSKKTEKSGLSEGARFLEVGVS